MYVIVEIAGQQFKAEKGRKLYVHRLPGEENSSVSFDKVLLADNDGQVKVVQRTAASRKASDSASNFSVVSSLKLATSSFAREVLSTIRART